MTIFDTLKDILYKKEGNLLDNPESITDFQPFLVQRWLSMYSGNVASLLNNTTNKIYKAFETKSEWYKIFLTIIPRTSFKQIKYIKKIKSAPSGESDEVIIEFLSKNKQISKREIRQYIKEFDIDVKQLKKALVKEKSNG